MVRNSLWVYGEAMPEVAVAFTEAKFGTKMHRQIAL